MRKIISSLTAVAAILSTSPAFAQEFSWRSVHTMDKLHEELFSRSVTDRVLDGSIEPEVRKVHTDHASNPPQFFLSSYQANMWVLERLHCANARQSLGLESASCLNFSKN